MAHEVLPAVAEAGIADRPAGKAGAASHDHVNIFTLSADEFDTSDFTTPAGVAGTKTSQVRRQQRVQAQLAAQRFIEHLELGVHQQDREVRIGKHVFDQTIAAVRL